MKQQASSSKFKTNCEDGIVSSFQKGFLREIKSSLVDCYQNHDSTTDQSGAEDKTLSSTPSDSYYKGKEFQFEENGNHITWTVSIRPVDCAEIPPGTWLVATPSEANTPASEEEKDKNLLEVSKSKSNPFESVVEDNVIYNLAFIKNYLERTLI